MTVRKTGLLGRYWIAIACLSSLAGLGMPLPPVQPAVQAQGQLSPMCIDEVSTHLWEVVSERAQQGRKALQNGQIQSAANHLAGALEFLGTVNDASIRARTLEGFIRTNSADAGWLIEEVDRLIELGEIEAVRTVLSPAQTAAQGLPSGYSALKTRLLAAIATDYAAIGDREVAFDLLSQAQQAAANIQGAELKAQALTAIAQGYVAAELWPIATDLANQALQQAESATHTHEIRRDRVIEPIAAIYAEAGRIDQALQVAASIDDPYTRDSAMGSTAIALTQAGQIEQAVDLLSTLSVTEPKIRTLFSIGIQLTRDGNEAQANRFFEQAIAAVETADHLPVDVVPTLIQAGLPDMAAAALAARPNDAFKATRLIDVAKAHIETENLTWARAVLAQAIAVTYLIEENYIRQDLVEPLVAQSIEAADYELAMAAIELISDSAGAFEAMTAYAKVARTAAAAGQLDIALEAAEAIDPSFMSVHSEAWLAIATAYATAGEFETALATTQNIDQLNSPHYAEALFNIGLQYQQMGMGEESETTLTAALQAATALGVPTASVEALNILALGYAKAEQPEPAAALFEEVLAAAIALPPESNSLFSLHDIADSWLAIGEPAFALRAIEAISDEYHQDAALQNWVDRLIEDTQYAQASEIVDTYNDPSTQTYQMLQLAEAYFQSGQTEPALAQLSRAYEVAQTIPGEESQLIRIREDLVVDDPLDRGSLYEAIAITYGQMGAFEPGLAVAQSLQEPEIRDWAIERVTCYRTF